VKKRGCLFWVLLALGGCFMCCCFSGALVAAGSDGEGNGGWGELTGVVAGEVPLGVAEVPDDRAPGGEREYHWREVMSRYGLGYGMTAEAHDEANGAHQALADAWLYKPGEPFWWTPPPECAAHPWRCIFDKVASSDAAMIAPLTELFRKRQQSAGLDIRAATEVVVSFVQHIPYRLPTEQPFGLLPPAMVVADGSGDCDSKSLLAAMILEDLGVDCVILYSSKLGHAALGVALPGTGVAFNSRGVRYQYVEMTVPGWAIGTVPPEYNKPKLWEVVPFERH
jgi:hypothetical protein